MFFEYLLNQIRTIEQLKLYTKKYRLINAKWETLKLRKQEISVNYTISMELN